MFGYIPTIDAAAAARADGLRSLVRGLPRRRWHTFDARNNTPRVGRVVVGRGRDAVDVALITSFGAVTLTEFTVVAQAA